MKLLNLFNNIGNRIYGKCCSHIYEKLDKRTPRHIVVIESDDWGSIRVPSKEVWNALKFDGYAMDTRPYERYDCLENDEDVKSLTEILLKYKDYKGNHPVLTLNYLSANPDFLRIKEDSYKKYSFVTLEETYQKSIYSSNVLTLIKNGINQGIFKPQCHGREHFNVLEWLVALQHGDKDVLIAFQYDMCGIFPKNNPTKGNQYMVALRSIDEKSQQYVCDTVAQSLEMFYNTWGYRSRTFIAPCYTWNDKIEDVLRNNGVDLLQSSRIRRSSDSSSEAYVYAGKKKNGIIYGVRNCSFEPATNQNYSTKALMEEVDHAFRENHVVVISSHRINYVGGISNNNRIKNLILLEEFLSTLLVKYPDVEFMSSDQLIEVLK